MQVNFYNNQSNENVINKKLDLITSKELIFRRSVNEQNPVLLVHNSILNNVNYVEIPTFKRFYFIDHTEKYNTQLSRIFLNTDLLMTYQKDILNNEMIITATEKPSYSSNVLPTTKQVISDKYNSDKELPLGTTKVLTTIGG